MNKIRKTTFCLFTLSVLGTSIGMLNSDSPKVAKSQPAVANEVKQKLEVEKMSNVSIKSVNEIVVENVPIEQEKEIARPLDVTLILQKLELMRVCEGTSLPTVLKFSGV